MCRVQSRTAKTLLRSYLGLALRRFPPTVCQNNPRLLVQIMTSKMYDLLTARFNYVVFGPQHVESRNSWPCGVMHLPPCCESVFQPDIEESAAVPGILCSSLLPLPPEPLPSPSAVCWGCRQLRPSRLEDGRGGWSDNNMGQETLKLCNQIMLWSLSASNSVQDFCVSRELDCGD